MKSEWLKCKECLFLVPESENHSTNECHFDTKVEYIDEDYFCSHWTCANCWQSWDEYFYRSDTSLLVYQDHSKCAMVQFGVREEPPECQEIQEIGYETP